MIPIAIIGIGCRFPGANGPDAFWKLLTHGVDVIREIPPDRWDAQHFYDQDLNAAGKSNSKWAGLLDDIHHFDFRFFGIPPDEAPYIDPQQRLLLEVAWEALEDAGLVLNQLQGSSTGVFVGLAPGDYCRLLMNNPDIVGPYTNAGNLLSIAANRISYSFDLRGPSIAIETACSSSLVALHWACVSLDRKESRVALAGGANAILTPELTIGFSKTKALSADGCCRAFDSAANGYVRGEGAGMVVLKPLSEALQDGDPIYAVIRGSAVNQDGRTNGLTAPNRFAQEQVLQTAYQQAGIAPHDVQYVEAHGTGTLMGDLIEANALGAVIGNGRQSGIPCAIGSVKTNIGHLETAAGIASIIKVALCLQRGKIPPSLHFNQPNPHIAFNQLGLKVQNKLEDWPAGRHLAGVSSFGFGGTNAHVVIEESSDTLASVAPNAETAETAFLLPLSARSPQALTDLVRSYLGFLTTNAGASLEDISWSASCRRTHHDYRLALVTRSHAELHEQLNTFLQQQSHPGLHSGQRRFSPGQIAFLFSHQLHDCISAQGYLEDRKVSRDVLRECTHLYKELVPQAWAEDFENPRKVFSQFAIQIAFAKLWLSYGITPGAVVGAGLGEIAAAHVAGIFDLPSAIKQLLLFIERTALSSRRNGTRLFADLKPSIGSMPHTRNTIPLFSLTQDRHAGALSGLTKSISVEAAPVALTQAHCHTFLEMDLWPRLGADISAAQPTLQQGTMTLPLGNSRRQSETLLDSVAALYVSGQSLNWREVCGPARRFVRIPPHPWRKEWCWFTPPPEADSLSSLVSQNA